MREAPAIVGDNGLYLSMTRVARLWSMRPGDVAGPKVENREKEGKGTAT